MRFLRRYIAALIDEHETATREARWPAIRDLLTASADAPTTCGIYLEVDDSGDALEEAV
jgi:hypothetical protein